MPSYKLLFKSYQMNNEISTNQNSMNWMGSLYSMENKITEIFIDTTDLAIEEDPNNLEWTESFYPHLEKRFYNVN